MNNEKNEGKKIKSSFNEKEKKELALAEKKIKESQLIKDNENKNLMKFYKAEQQKKESEKNKNHLLEIKKLEEEKMKNELNKIKEFKIAEEQRKQEEILRKKERQKRRREEEERRKIKEKEEEERKKKISFSVQELDKLEYISNKNLKNIEKEKEFELKNNNLEKENKELKIIIENKNIVLSKNKVELEELRNQLDKYIKIVDDKKNKEKETNDLLLQKNKEIEEIKQISLKEKNSLIQELEIAKKQIETNKLTLSQLNQNIIKFKKEEKEIESEMSNIFSNTDEKENESYEEEEEEEPIDYSYVCLTKNLTIEVEQGVNEIEKELILKNDGKTWRENQTKLLFDKENSLVIGEDIDLPPLKKEETYKCTLFFKDLNNLEPKKYKSYLKFSIDNNIIGAPLTLYINISKLEQKEKNNKVKEMIKKFRDTYNISIEDFSDSFIESALKSKNCDFLLAYRFLKEGN